MLTATQNVPDPGWVALAKLTYGFSPIDSERFKHIGLAAWLDSQLDPKLNEGDECEDKLAGYRTLNMIVEQVSRFSPYIKNKWLAGQELSEATLIRRLHSRRQLYELLVEHFNEYLYIPLHCAWQSRIAFDRDVIRSNALGSYPDMLVASSVHPAMLDYLEGNENTRYEPNENYGRALGESHTITSLAGFREKDVVNAARVFSGISWDQAANGLAINPDKHWSGSVSVFGWTNANLSTNPEVILKTSESLVRYLAMRPETAMSFSARLAHRFVSDNPSASLLSLMAEKYLRTGGDIPRVVGIMIRSSEFMANAGKKARRPMGHFGSVVRMMK